MTKKTRIYWLHAVTPLHVGTGIGLGYIDLPIMREKVTNWPLVPGSAIKGVISDTYKAQDSRAKDEKKQDLSDEILCAFGRAGDEHSNSGSLVFTDGRIVCLPVRSLYGTFAWCTSALVLQRLARDLQQAGTKHPTVPATASDTQASIPRDPASKLKNVAEKIYLEDLDFDSVTHPDITEWANWLSEQVFPDQNEWQTTFKERFVVLPNNIFDFLCETGTEVNARIRINDNTKTVDQGALWYEEALPAETILSGLIWCDRVFGPNGANLKPENLLDNYCTHPMDLQIGGKATVGRGRVHCLFTEGE
ncbi:MAG: type III-B CRISPR module RAMP protein Cmr4 [Syntrophaceae bacterium]|nr:type III-B CRISPR module RAMP protein Cmr4 [Syntrophaceae bacterium]